MFTIMISIASIALATFSLYQNRKLRAMCIRERKKTLSLLNNAKVAVEAYDIMRESNDNLTRCCEDLIDHNNRLIKENREVLETTRKMIEGNDRLVKQIREKCK